MSKYFKDPHDCVHAWAHQLYECGHSNHLYFIGKTIYDGGTIAYLDGTRVFLTTTSFSSRDRHKEIIRSYISDKKIVLVISPHIEASVPPDKDTAFHRFNLDSWAYQLSELSDRYRQFQTTNYYSRTFRIS